MLRHAFHGLTPCLVAALALAGCNPADSHVPNKAAAPDASTNEVDASDACLGSACPPGSDGGDDSGPPECDGGPCPPPPCASDSECTEDQYCSARTLTCTARCSEEFGCAAPFESEWVWYMAADQLRVYWTESTKRDVFGGVIKPGGVWSWDLQNAPVRLADGFFPVKMVVDGVIYFEPEHGKHGADEIWRMPADGSAPPELIPNASAVWSTTDFVWWSVRVPPRMNCDLGEPCQAELWRKARTPDGKAEPELVGTAAHWGWLAGTATHVLSYHTVFFEDEVWSRVVESTPIDDLDATPSTLNGDVFGGTIRSDEHYFYHDSYEIEILWQMTGDFAEDFVLFDKGLGPDEGFTFNYQVKGDWAYWSHSDWSNDATTYGRTASRSETPPETLVTLTASTPGGVVALGSKLVYSIVPENRLFVKEMPPLPCSMQLRCPDGLSCGDDALCH